MPPKHPGRRWLLATAVLAAALSLMACTVSSGGHAAGHSSPTATASNGYADASAAKSSPTTQEWAHISPALAKRAGEVVTRTIPGGTSGFVPRPAEIYLPPAALANPHSTLPVLELLHGVPGGPTDWLLSTKGNLFPIIEAFAKAHGGQAPVIVMPDINGSYKGDTECIRTPTGGNVEQYLASIVPTWISANLPVTSNHRDWAVAGLSEGGTCAAMLALRHPHTFATFGDFSGLAHLTVGDHNNEPLTVTKLFGGSTTAYNRHDPPYLLTHGGSRAGMAAWFQCGNRDTESLRDQNLMIADARNAGVAVQAVVVPGSHHWIVWTNAIAQMIPWWWARMSA